jgi:hypothetical protein
MEVNPGYQDESDWDVQKDKIRKVLGEHNLCYVKGGLITAVGGTIVTKTLQDIIRTGDLSGVQIEFDRIYANVESDPPAAVTASCALLESVFKTYIEAHGDLALPSEQSIKPLWKVIRADLKFDPGASEDDDLRTILTGLANIVEGTGSLRTHKGSAHGRQKRYTVKPRHARLTAHAACTLAIFVLEAWHDREPTKQS